MERRLNSLKQLENTAESAKQQIQFNIHQVADVIGVVPATIRNWEKAGLFVAKRSANNYRSFDFNDLEILKRIVYYQREEGLSLSVIRRLLSNDSGVLQQNGKKYYKEIYNKKLKEYREAQGYTLEQASAAVGISSSYLSRIEQGRSNVSYNILDKLATFYGESTIYFFDLKSEKQETVLRAGKGKTLETGLSGTAIESLINQNDRAFQVIKFTVEPGGGDFKSHCHHSGYEFIYLLEGNLEVVLDEQETHLLQSGDSIQFESMRMHKWRNAGCQTVILLWIHSYL